MDERRFDELVRALQGSVGSRRRALRALLVALGVPGVTARETAAERPLDRLRRRTPQRNRKQRNTKKQNKKNKHNNQNNNNQNNNNQNNGGDREGGGGGGGPGSPGACTPNGSVCRQGSECCAGNCFNFVCAETLSQCTAGGTPIALQISAIASLIGLPSVAAHLPGAR